MNENGNVETSGLKVLHVLPVASSRFGGPAFGTMGMAASLSRLGMFCELIASDMSNAPSAPSRRVVAPAELPSEAASVNLRLFRTRPPRRLVYAPALGRYCRQAVSSFDIVHIHSLWLYPQYAAFREARRQRVPYVVSPHGALDPFLRRKGRGRKRLVTEVWQRAMLEQASLIHVLTTDEEALIEDIAPNVPREIVPSGLSLGPFRELPPDSLFRDGCLNGHSGPLVLFLGRISFKKGIDILIRAMCDVVRDAPGAMLAVVGPDDEGLTPELAGLAGTLGIGDKVVFTGRVSDEQKMQALSAADVWALSSHTENFGYAVIEAMAAGVPVVVSPEVNLAPDIAEAGAGEVAKLTPADFAQALARVLRDTSYREHLGKEAGRFAERFDWHKIAPLYADMYFRVTGAGSAHVSGPVRLRA